MTSRVCALEVFHCSRVDVHHKRTSNAIRKSHVRAMRHICTDKLTSGNELYTLPPLLKAIWKSVKSQRRRQPRRDTSKAGRVFFKTYKRCTYVYLHIYRQTHACLRTQCTCVSKYEGMCSIELNWIEVNVAAHHNQTKRWLYSRLFIFLSSIETSTDIKSGRLESNIRNLTSLPIQNRRRQDIEH